MDQSTAVLPLQRPKDVSVADIEQELNKVWSSTGDSNAARAATFNLLVYESLDTSTLLPSDPVESIATQNPCRVIDMRAKPESADNTIEAQVAAYCPLSHERSNLVCCEYITLQAAESAFVRLGSTVGSLLINELPTYLWWNGDLDLNSPLFQQMASLSDRIIVDSRDFVNPEEDLGEIQQLTDQGQHCGDLNWRRLSPWQELTAQAFDPPDRRQALAFVDHITIDYNGGNPCQALLFLGWIAGRLGWKPLERIRTLEHDAYLIDRIKLSGPNNQIIEAELAAVPLAGGTAYPGDLIGLKLTAADPNVDACTVLCSETTGCMRMETMGGAQACQIRQVSPMKHESLANLLSQQLQRIGPDRLFEESLNVAAELLAVGNVTAG
ncbi:MAG: glucose-6-phosphate dehydrogenase assembly protein OpcA [Cyanophyceae cyanobacterium]